MLISSCLDWVLWQVHGSENYPRKIASCWKLIAHKMASFLLIFRYFFPPYWCSNCTYDTLKLKWSYSSYDIKFFVVVVFLRQSCFRGCIDRIFKCMRYARRRKKELVPSEKHKRLHLYLLFCLLFNSEVVILMLSGLINDLGKNLIASIFNQRLCMYIQYQYQVSFVKKKIEYIL